MFRNSWRLLMAGGISVLACRAAPPPAQTPDAPSALPGAAPSASPTPAAPAAAAPGAAVGDVQIGVATASAKSWLALVDAEKYAQSWAEAAKAFQGAVTQESWVSSVSGVRGPLGNLVSREMRSAERKTALPGAPDGNYVVIQFSTVFDKKAEATETLTSTQEADGSWKVTGYFIR
jgi:hypothetical protein